MITAADFRKFANGDFSLKARTEQVVEELEAQLTSCIKSLKESKEASVLRQLAEYRRHGIAKVWIFHNLDDVPALVRALREVYEPRGFDVIYGVDYITLKFTVPK